LIISVWPLLVFGGLIGMVVWIAGAIYDWRTEEAVQACWPSTPSQTTFFIEAVASVRRSSQLRQQDYCK
jgi:hypothetical protein